MAKVAGDRKNQGKASPDTAVKEYVQGLSREHKMLVVLKRELYGGSWKPMLSDLDNRLAGKPYIFKLTNRIKDDKERIGQLQAFETAHGVDLSDYVELS